MHPARESPAEVPPRSRERPVVRPPLPSLAEIIARITSDKRKHPVYRVEDIVDRAVSEVRLPSLPVKGCIVRFALFVMLLIALAIGGLYLLVGGGMQSFVIDLGQSTGVMEGTPAQTVRGIEAFRRGDLQTAGRELSQAAVTYPRSALALLYLARMRTDAGDLSGAGEYLEAAVLREPANAVANRDLGLNYLFKARASDQAAGGEVASRNNLIEADRFLAAAALLNPSDRTSRGYRGCVLAALGAVDEAERLLSLAGDGPWQRCASVNR
ncbi:MAG: hypothetical protein H0U13_09675 [Gemmatimonadaceae bacterium]|nr:hypothetical protein [Gemmatimonadaceae bacterium]